MKRRFRTTAQLLRVRDVFDEWAQNGRAEGMERGHGPIARQAFDALEVSAGERFLDIGCGNGYAVRWAAQVAPSVNALGLDVATQMIALARDSTIGLPNARFRRGGFPMTELPQGQFHAVLSVEAFYYLPDVAAGLRAVHALLAPGGRFGCVVDHYAENPASHSWSTDLGVPMHLLSGEEWQQLFVDAGFAPVQQRHLRESLVPGQRSTWKHTQGSLFTLAIRP